MFSELKAIVDIVRNAIEDVHNRSEKSERQETVVRLLEMYFLMKDCVDEAQSLIEEAGPNPKQTISSLDQHEAISTLGRWDISILRQGYRLRALDGYLVGEHALSVIAPDLQQKIKKIIGSKSKHVSRLYEFGARTFFLQIFPVNDRDEQTLDLISVMSGGRDSLFDLKKAEQEINDFKSSLEDFRSIVQRLLSDEEILKFSNLARKEIGRQFMMEA